VRCHLALSALPRPPSDRLADRAGGRKPEVDLRLSERLRSVDDAVREGGPGASGCRKRGHVRRTAAATLQVGSGGNLG
jgi:hypothetical protein